MPQCCFRQSKCITFIAQKNRDNLFIQVQKSNKYIVDGKRKLLRAFKREAVQSFSGKKTLCEPGRNKLGRWNERGRAIELWCKGLGATKETKQDGRKRADIILDRQRDYPEDVSHYPVAFICCKQLTAKEQIIFPHVRFLFCLIFPPRTNMIEYSSTSVFFS